MPRATATVSVQAIELKSSLLPASLLEQVARLQAPMQKEADYGLAKGERLRERIDAAWVRLKEIWEEYKDLRERAAQSTAGLHFAQRLLREVLGWPDLQACTGWQHGDSFYPISHRALAEPRAAAATSQGTSQASVPLILRGIPADQLDRGSAAFGQEGRLRSPPQLSTGMPQCRRQRQLGPVAQRRSPAPAARQPIPGEAGLPAGGSAAAGGGRAAR
jgi:hypothetical protein